MTAAKRTPETIAKILVALAKGCPFETAALGANVSPKTVRSWMTMDEDLALQIEIAISACEMTDVDVIDKAITGTDIRLAVKTAQWRRERLNPSVWGTASRNDSFSRDKKVRELAEELRREGLDITDEQVFKELAQLEHKALPSGQKS